MDILILLVRNGQKEYWEKSIVNVLHQLLRIDNF